jgi:hypothetical protein
VYGWRRKGCFNRRRDLAFSNCLHFLRAGDKPKNPTPILFPWVSSSFDPTGVCNHLHSLAFLLHEWRVWEGLLSSCQPQAKSCAWPSTSNSILRDLLASTTGNDVLCQSSLNSIPLLKPMTCWRFSSSSVSVDARHVVRLLLPHVARTSIETYLEVQAISIPSSLHPVFLQLMQNPA